MKRIALDLIPEDRIVFYDLETTHQYAPYCALDTLQVQYGLRGKPKFARTKAERNRFKRFVQNPRNYSVAFNSLNFDNIVLARYGVNVNPRNHHDVFLIFKTIAPNLTAFSLKYLAFFFFGDPHFPEMDLLAYCREHGVERYEVPKHISEPYGLHDIVQLVKLFRLSYDVVIRDVYWKPYQQDMRMGLPVREMILKGGTYIDRNGTWYLLQQLQKKQQKLAQEAIQITHGQVQNPNSSKQLGQYLTEFQKIEVELTDQGQFSLNKRALTDLKSEQPIARIAFEYREALGTVKFLENYLKALDDPLYKDRGDWLPYSVSISSARTRRFTSSSYYHINFQNANSLAKSVHTVPQGWLDIRIDSTQIENVVHIYESADTIRRRAYERDPTWNEYVWLCNQILGTNYTKEELDDPETMRSPRNPNWTIYKENKTGKLAMNFGMGLRKFSQLYGLVPEEGARIFEQIHEACPAIRYLITKVARNLQDQGYVQDVFGYRYSGPTDKAYKVVAYLIQGCGTGSLPKAQIRANWQTLEKFRAMGLDCVLCGTTHDETVMRAKLGKTNLLLQLLQECMYNMTEKFSPRFDDIPLRAKLYLSTTNAKEAKELDLSSTDDIATTLEMVKGS